MPLLQTPLDKASLTEPELLTLRSCIRHNRNIVEEKLGAKKARQHDRVIEIPGINALLYACKKGKHKIIQIILDELIEEPQRIKHLLNETDEEGRNALHYAFNNILDEETILKLLMHLDVDNFNKLIHEREHVNKISPFEVAIQRQSFNVLQHIISLNFIDRTKLDAQKINYALNKSVLKAHERTILGCLLNITTKLQQISEHLFKDTKHYSTVRHAFLHKLIATIASPNPSSLNQISEDIEALKLHLKKQRGLFYHITPFNDWIKMTSELIDNLRGFVQIEKQDPELAEKSVNSLLTLLENYMKHLLGTYTHSRTTQETIEFIKSAILFHSDITQPLYPNLDCLPSGIAVEPTMMPHPPGEPPPYHSIHHINGLRVDYTYPHLTDASGLVKASAPPICDADNYPIEESNDATTYRSN